MFLIGEVFKKFSFGEGMSIEPSKTFKFYICPGHWHGLPSWTQSRELRDQFRPISTEADQFSPILGASPFRRESESKIGQRDQPLQFLQVSEGQA